MKNLIWLLILIVPLIVVLDNFTDNDDAEHIIKLLKDDEWLQENVYLNKNRFGSTLETQNQKLYFLPVLDKKYVVVEAISEKEYSAQTNVIFYNDKEINVILLERIPRNIVIDELINVDTSKNILKYSSNNQGAYMENYYKFDESGIIETTVYTHIGEDNLGNDFQRDFLINDENVDQNIYEERKKEFEKELDFQKIKLELTDENVDMYIK